MDYTIFWWQLSICSTFLNKFTNVNDNNVGNNVNVEELMKPLLPCFYNIDVLNDTKKTKQICDFLKQWLTIASKQNVKSSMDMQNLMRENSPKLVPREWMFTNAYKIANQGDYTMVQELYELFKNPYRLTEDNDIYCNKYYRKAPKCTYEGIGLGGEAYMT